MKDLADPPRLVGFDVPSLKTFASGTDGEMKVLLDKEAPAQWKSFFDDAVSNASAMIREGRPTVQATTISVRVMPSNVGSMRFMFTEFLSSLNTRYVTERAETSANFVP
ncbi:MAG: hypothetical protein ABI129_10230 [Rhodanobacter sp.]